MRDQRRRDLQHFAIAFGKVWTVAVQRHADHALTRRWQNERELVLHCRGPVDTIVDLESVQLAQRDEVRELPDGSRHGGGDQRVLVRIRAEYLLIALEAAVARVDCTDLCLPAVRRDDIPRSDVARHKPPDLCE